MKTKKITNNKKKAISRRTINKIVLGAGLFAAMGGATAVYRFLLEDPLYERAGNNPVLQQEWVVETLRKYGKDSLYSDIVILTPQNARQYADEYPRYRTLDTVTTHSVEINVDDYGTERVPKPKLFVPTNMFGESEGDLTSIIALHETNHVKTLRNGFDFMKMMDFTHKDNPNLFIYDMFHAVYELEAHKEQIEQGSNLMSSQLLEQTRGNYMNYYVQLWRYGDSNIKEDTNRTLKSRYFQPWMRNSNSIIVFLDKTDNSIRYEATSNIPFLVQEGGQFYIQFMFRQGSNTQLYRRPLPKELEIK